VGEAQTGQTAMTSEGTTPRLSLASSVTAALLCGVLALLLAGFVVLAVQTHQIVNDGANTFAELAFGAVGFVLALRQPRNPIGWLLLLTAFWASLLLDARLYSVVDYRLHHGTLPLGLVAVLISGSLWAVAFLIGTPAALLFPDGRVPSARWRWVWWTYLVLCFLLVAGQVIGALGMIGQRIHVDASGNATNSPTGVLADFQISGALLPALIPIWLSWAAYQVGSYRRSMGERRQQLKWVSCGAAICLVSLVAQIFLSSSSSEIGKVAHAISLFGISAFPISIGIAMLKYRLYEIDRLISRTLSYAIVTGLVVGAYIGIITLVTRVLGLSSPVAVAASTLAAVALFNPLRSRVQRVVDRRFNRARYDAEATLASFTARLRDAIDLETVQTELLEVVNRAVEPAHASVWIRRRE